MQLSYDWAADLGNLQHLLSRLVGKGYIAADNGASRSEPVYALTELGTARLATLRTRFGVMIRERLLLVDPVKLRAIHRVLKTFMAQNGISLKPRLHRFHWRHLDNLKTGKCTQRVVQMTCVSSERRPAGRAATWRKSGGPESALSITRS